MRLMELKDIPVGRKALLGKVKVKVSLTTSGCTGCVFQRVDGARFCEFTPFCFAHNRPDNKSVVFLKVDK